MQYIRKICILKQVSAGFAADGKTLSALLTAESYGGRLTATLAAIGLAPLSAGRYRAVLCDAHGTAELFDLPSPAGFTAKRQSALEPADGLGCALLYVNGAAKAVAFGKSGEHAFDLAGLCALADESQPPATAAAGGTRTDGRGKNGDGQPCRKAVGAHGQAESAQQTQAESAPPYDDEAVADVNYFAFADAEKESAAAAYGAEQGAAYGAEQGAETPSEGVSDAQTGGAADKAQADGRDAGEDEDAQSLFRRAGSEERGADEGACYYDQVRADLDALFERYPAEEELAKSIPLSRWAKIAFGEGKHYAVGVIRDETRVKYICYGVPAERRGEPPDALKKWCSFLPLSVFDMNGKGYWMMFQDAETGACVKLEQA